MAYYAVLGESPIKRKLDFVKFDFSQRVMILRNAIYDKKRNTFTNKNIDENEENNEDFSEEVLKFMFDFTAKNPQEVKLAENLDQIMSEDKKLLKKLTK